ncbi:MAG: efflux RND transporter periplasmic adaptor subunit [Deltaproteobacteria bacterium]|nr:efflux RND transporter periplasmic adaptor subunit [Deltaproteobacteria bacterium]
MLLLGAACRGKGQKETGPTGPSPTVLVAPVLQKTVPIYVEYVGRTEALESVEIRARVEGYLEKIYFKEGSVVKAGQLLFLIDQRPYKAALDDARGQLAQAEAALWKAQKDVDRLRPLAAAKAVPQQDLDKAEAEARYSRASIEKAKAMVEKAELNLEFTQIRAPVTGVIGKHEVTVGNLVTKDQTLLTTLSSWDPMRVVFSISETDYLKLARKYPQTDKSKAKDPRAIFELLMADNSIYPYKGTLSFVDRALDLTTGTLKIYVSFPNPDMLLRPGLFARIRLALEEKPDALLVPQKAVQEMQGVKTVLVVGPENKVALHTVTLGPRYQEYFIITKGVKAGEQVIVEGLQKAIPGQKVTPKKEPVSREKPASPTKKAGHEQPPSPEKGE